MKIKAIVEGKEVELTTSDEDAEKIGIKRGVTKTGYERRYDNSVYAINPYDEVCCMQDDDSNSVSALYNVANYYSCKELALANARADALMRKLRRYAAEHGGISSYKDWSEYPRTLKKYSLVFSYINYGQGTYPKLFVQESYGLKHPFSVYFNTEEAANAAIKEFYDELIWYFTEYEGMLHDKQ